METPTFMLRLQRFAPLVEAISGLARIAKHADILFTPGYLRFVTSHHSPSFIATLEMPKGYFAEYSVDDHHAHCSNLSLETFHDAILDTTFSSSMAIHLLPNTNQMLLTFHDSNGNIQLSHKLQLLPPQERIIEEIDFEKIFCITSPNLRRVIKELPLFQDNSVRVTASCFQVKFSVGSAEIIFTTKDGECENHGFRGEDEIDIKINVTPMLFFINLSYDVERVFFYKTIRSSYGVMFFPVFQLSSEYVFYFPQI